jgi:hypothetical protein
MKQFISLGTDRMYICVKYHPQFMDHQSLASPLIYIAFVECETNTRILVVLFLLTLC